VLQRKADIERLMIEGMLAVVPGMNVRVETVVSRSLNKGELDPRYTDGLIDADVTIQTCWDADRLDLGRVGITPERTKLCTRAAKRQEMIRWADGRAAFEIVPEIVEAEWGIDLRSD